VFFAQRIENLHGELQECYMGIQRFCG